ncbi:MAG TPA: FAD-dependent oxidoreductase [Ktedonobacterales bacterium]|nr:FAD-dependent oxidoreductase [Ktedonobacterales bacterium]
MAQRIVIIGAGPVGLGAGYRLQELGYTDWAIYERHPYIGGLATSFQDDAGFTYDIGGHVMFSHYPYFDRLVDTLLGDDYTDIMRESWVWMMDRWIPYPFQNNIRHLPPEALLECLNGLIDARDMDPRETRNFGEWTDAIFGSGIARYFMRPYNFKVWAHPLELMSKEWMAERVSVIDLKRILKNVVMQRDEVSWGPNNTFKYPLRGGTGGLYSRFEPYVREHLHLNRALVGVDVEEKRVFFADGTQDSYDMLISAVPIPELLKMIRPAPIAQLDAAPGLHNSHGLVVGVGVARPCPSEKCWIYFPEASAPFYRVTYLSNYSPYIAPEGHFLLLTETSYSDFKREDKATIVDRVVEGLIATKMLEPEDRNRIAATYTIDVDYFYPVPSLTRDVALDVIQPYLMRHGIYSRGRFGAWEYEIGNMDHSVMQGVEAVNHIALAEPETTWIPPRPAAIPSISL